jgi:hypothetical protein
MTALTVLAQEQVANANGRATADATIPAAILTTRGASDGAHSAMLASALPLCPIVRPAAAPARLAPLAVAPHRCDDSLPAMHDSHPYIGYPPHSYPRRRDPQARELSGIRAGPPGPCPPHLGTVIFVNFLSPLRLSGGSIYSSRSTLCHRSHNIDDRIWRTVVEDFIHPAKLFAYVHENGEGRRHTRQVLRAPVGIHPNSPIPVGEAPFRFRGHRGRSIAPYLPLCQADCV